MIQKSRLLAGHSASAIQMLEAQNEELREEIEDLRSQLESVSTGQHINGNVNGGRQCIVYQIMVISCVYAPFI